MNNKLDKNTFVALAAIAWSDGDLAKEEAQALHRAAVAWGIVGEELAEVDRCIQASVPLEVIEQLDLERDARLLVYALGAWLARADGVVVPAEGTMLERLASLLGLSDEERHLAETDGMLAVAVMGESGNVLALAREIEERANVGLEETERLERRS